MCFGKFASEIKMSHHLDKNFTEICSERTIFSDQQGFFGEMFEVVRNCCSEKWLKTKFEASSSDGDKLRLLFDEPNVSDMLLGTLEHVTSVYRKKDSSFSYQKRIEGEYWHEHKDLNKALSLLTLAVLRAPGKGEKQSAFESNSNSKPKSFPKPMKPNSHQNHGMRII